MSMNNIGYFVCATFIRNGNEGTEDMDRAVSRKMYSFNYAVRLARRLQRRLSKRLGQARVALVEVIDAGINTAVWRERTNS